MRFEDVKNTALSQVGYKEGKNNWTIYARDLDAVKYYDPQKKQNVDWCATFVNWIFWMNCNKDKTVSQNKLYQPHKYNLSAGVEYMCNYFKKAGKFSKMPKKGAVIFFGTTRPTHVGIVIDVVGSTKVTVEGNSSNQVRKRTYTDNTKIYGYGYVDYDDTPGGKIMLEVRELYYNKGNVFKGEDVKSIQAIVGAEQDGSFGPKTQTKVKAWQKAHGLSNDGIVGPKTYNAMFKAG